MTFFSKIKQNKYLLPGIWFVFVVLLLVLISFGLDAKTSFCIRKCLSVGSQMQYAGETVCMCRGRQVFTYE